MKIQERRGGKRKGKKEKREKQFYNIKIRSETQRQRGACEYDYLCCVRQDRLRKDEYATPRDCRARLVAAQRNAGELTGASACSESE